jgi:stress response protein YsnF
MATTIVGLYRTEADVQRVTDELSSHGFTHYEVNRDDRTGADLRNWLENRGVPDREAEDYVIGVNNGGKLVTLEASDDRTDEALEIMLRHERSTAGMGTTAGTTGTAAMGTTGDRTEGYIGTTGGKLDDPARSGRKDRTKNRVQNTGGEETFEVVEEEIDIGTREVERGGVRVRSYVTERPVEEEVRLRGERVDVERRPVDRPLAKGEVDRAFEERTVSMTEKGEEAVVGKRARVVEEVVLRKDVEERTERIRDTVRRTDVEVERTDEVLRADREHYMSHHRDTVGGTEHEYGEREPAYRFGIDLAHHPDYRGRTWDEVAPEAREHWVRHNGETWLEYEPAVRYSYERASERQRM